MKELLEIRKVEDNTYGSLPCVLHMFKRKCIFLVKIRCLFQTKPLLRVLLLTGFSLQVKP